MAKDRGMQTDKGQFRDSTNYQIEKLLLDRMNRPNGTLKIECKSRNQAVTIKASIYKYAKKLRIKAEETGNYDELYRAANTFSMEIMREDDLVIVMKPRSTMISDVLQENLDKLEALKSKEDKKVLDNIEDEIEITDRNKNRFYSR